MGRFRDDKLYKGYMIQRQSMGVGTWGGFRVQNTSFAGERFFLQGSAMERIDQHIASEVGKLSNRERVDKALEEIAGVLNKYNLSIDSIAHSMNLEDATDGYEIAQAAWSSQDKAFRTYYNFDRS